MTIDYGSDVGGVFDVDPTLSIVTGLRALATRILRRLFTPRGGLVGNPTYGFDVLTLIGSSLSASVVEQRVLEQTLAEQGVENARVRATMNQGELRIELDVVAEDGEPLTLTIVATELQAATLFNGNLFDSTTLPRAA